MENVFFVGDIVTAKEQVKAIEKCILVNRSIRKIIKMKKENGKCIFCGRYCDRQKTGKRLLKNAY